MSDENTGVPAPTPAPAGIHEHWCEHPGCVEWGCFGFATGKGEPRWFCGEHRGDGEQA